MVLDMVVVIQSNPDLVPLILLQPKVVLVVVVLGNKEQVLHLTKAHTLVGHLTETLEVTDTLLAKLMLEVEAVVLAVLVLTQQMVKLQVLVV